MTDPDTGAPGGESPEPALPNHDAEQPKRASRRKKPAPAEPTPAAQTEIPTGAALNGAASAAPALEAPIGGVAPMEEAPIGGAPAEEAPIGGVVPAEELEAPIGGVAPAEELEAPIGGAAPAEEAPIGVAPAEELEAPIGGVAPAEELELPIGGLRAETEAAVQELEVEIRNQGESGGDARDVAAEALRLIRENLARLSPPSLERVSEMIRQNVLSSDYLDPDFWRGIAMVLQYQADEISGLVQRRLKGEYELDAYGMDQELIDIVRPFAAFMYRTWWRVTAEGLEHVPAEGPALLAANHSGALPWDSAMIATAVLEEHPQPRLVRALHAGWLAGVPVMAPALAAFGQVPGLPENAARLLEAGELTCVFPEGAQGPGKLFWNRYKLASFDAEGYVQAALRAGAPIVPVAVVGAEEIYPMVADARPVARLLGFPYFPLTPLFPWLGLLGLIPLPSKWTIVFDEPIATAGFGPGAADDPATVKRLAELLRARIQGLLDERAPARKSIFFGR